MKKVFILASILSILFLVGAVSAQTASKILTWTAPGDDGNIGTASGYEGRYSIDSTALVAWAVIPPASVIKITGLPIPALAGTTQTFTVTGLTTGMTYFFAIKSVDEVGNWSLISNILKYTPADTTPPAAIIDLR